MYWHIGQRIHQEVLQGKRAEYGKQVIASLSVQLTEEYGRGWSEKKLRHCLHFIEVFPDIKIISTLWRQLSDFKLLEKKLHQSIQRAKQKLLKNGDER